MLTGLVLIISGFIAPAASRAQKKLISQYMSELTPGKPDNDGNLQKYRMTAVYTNRDLYGNFTGKTKVSGDYTRGFKDDSVTWNNVLIASSAKISEPFPAGTKQEYMEDMTYIPSDKMIREDAFKNFPSSPENILARNLIWDMISFETFAWDYLDSLKLNKPYIIPDISGQFDMAEIGKYSHNKILLCWKGITNFNGKLCAVIDFYAIDNIIELSIAQISTKGTEQYWGTVMVSLKTKNIEQGIMYSGTIQEITVKGMKDKFLAKTIRELRVEKIK